MEIYPSLISADILNLKTVITQLDSHCNGYHIDVMDDHFVPNLTWGAAFINAIQTATNLPTHIHLMVDTPQTWSDRLALREGDIFIFHGEAVSDPEKIRKLISQVKEKNWKVGLAVNPATPIEIVFEFLPALDHVLIMSVNPGFSGQKFMPEVVDKVKPLVEKRNQDGLVFTIGMDGGIGQDNIGMLAQAGVEQFGIASALFSADDLLATLKKLYTS